MHVVWKKNKSEKNMTTDDDDKIKNKDNRRTRTLSFSSKRGINSETVILPLYNNYYYNNIHIYIHSISWNKIQLFI